MSATATKPSYTPEVFENLKRCALWDGWESLENWMLVKGELPVGKRAARRFKNTNKAPQAINELEQHASKWPAYRLRKAVEQNQGLLDIALYVHPLDEDYGFSTELVALADSMFGSGGWRTGVCSASPVNVLAKVHKGAPLAMIAASRRTDWWLV